MTGGAVCVPFFKNLKKCFMKKLKWIFVLVIIVGFTSCNEIYHNTLKGDGNVISSEKTVSPFSMIQTSGSVNVNFHASQEYRAQVAVDSNLLEYVKVSVENNTLHIGTKNGSYSFTTFVVDVYCPFVSEVSISGSGDFTGLDKICVPKFESNISGSGNIKGTFECDKFSARVSGSANIAGTVECQDFLVQISGSGDVRMKGNATNINVSVSGSGSFEGNEFKTHNAIVNLSGSGDVMIWVEESLKARIAGSGEIRYRGKPKIDFSSSGSGRLISD